MAERMNKLVIDNARLIFKNFSGKGDNYNREGDRNFAVIVDDPNAAKDLANAGWNVRPLISKDPDEEPTHYIKVKVSFKVRAPKVRLLSNHKQVFLNENTISSLDFAKIEECGVVISPYMWEVNGKRGISAYLDSMYAKIEDDPFASKYADYVETEIDNPDGCPF